MNEQLKLPRTFDQIEVGEFFRSPEDVKCRKAGPTTAIMWEAGDSAYLPGETVPFHPAEIAEYSQPLKLPNGVFIQCRKSYGREPTTTIAHAPCLKSAHELLEQYQEGSETPSWYFLATRPCKNWSVTA